LHRLELGTTKERRRKKHKRTHKLLPPKTKNIQAPMTKRTKRKMKVNLRLQRLFLPIVKLKLRQPSLRPQLKMQQTRLKKSYLLSRCQKLKRLTKKLVALLIASLGKTS